MGATDTDTLAVLLAQVRACRACEGHLPHAPRPILRAGETARILVVGHAPGLQAHSSGTPWDDASGERLRAWMGLDSQAFYDESRVAIISIGYCYPGRGRGGDLPPRPECAALWLDRLLAKLPRIETTLLIGVHAQRRFLGQNRKQSLTATVRAWREFAPRYLPLPHPSARNTPWFRRHRWFDDELLPGVRRTIAERIAR